jgi:hypothetical protein
MNLHVTTADRTLLPRGLIKRPRSAAELRIVQRVKALIDAMNAADEADNDELERTLLLSMDALRGEVAAAKSTTPELAILQLAMAISELDRFDACWIADEQGNEALRQIQKLATSALTFVELETGINREDIGAEYFAGFRVEN